ncbi:MAG TPA: hypothetical protein VJP02_12555 [Candidatus Sulfotelmatobacter sp.]|nr:hypothetical protein [Candidatus Sulfotelmatobacter sp.]
MLAPEGRWMAEVIVGQGLQAGAEALLVSAAHAALKRRSSTAVHSTSSME